MRKGCPLELHVLLKKSEGVMITEVFELDQGILAVASHHGIHKLVNKCIVLVAGDALVATTNVEFVL